ncbi:MAG: hypothetical protein MUO42_04830 [Anaerolineaceae bacterium]|nr:hypothetical protein [Anaerolineaceae bacterium]
MITRLENQLNDFDLNVRKKALHELLTLTQKRPNLLPPQANLVNMHCHSFFSFNSYGFSPSALVWLALRKGLKVAGIVDFDTLDGIEEFLEGCDLTEVHSSAAMETRIYIPEFSTRVTNSPGEPGISYHMGIGFTSQSINQIGKDIMAKMRQRADARNRDIVGRLNAYLDPVAIDYDHDVIPLTPAGNVTERHILVAYLDAVKRHIKQTLEYWSNKLDLDKETVSASMADTAKFSDLVRRKLIKRGGVAYIQPSPETFPTAEEFHEMVQTNGALPTICYLDGSTDGELCMEELLELLTGKGVVAMNMIPNLAIPELQENPDNSSLRQYRCDLLYRTARLAEEFDLPLHIGTEMNSFGQRQVDDLYSPELSQLREQFIQGAFFIYGHTRLQRELGIGYQSEWAKAYLPTRAMRNQFYIQVGMAVTPGQDGINKLKKLQPSMNPVDIIKGLKNN